MAPKPVVTCEVCSECGLEWSRHEKKTLRECIRLLQEDLVKRSQWSYTMGSSQQLQTTYPNVTAINKAS